MGVNNYSKWAKYLIYIIWAFFLFSIIYDLFIIPARSIFWAGELILAVLIYYKFKIPVFAYFGVLALFLANLFGELFLGLFYIIPTFDKILHLLSPLVGCTFFYFLFDKKIQNKKILVLFSVTLLLSFGFLFELVEYFFDQNFNTLLQGVHNAGVEKFNPHLGAILPRFEDTIYDMILNLIGSIIFAIGALLILKKKEKK